MDFGGGKSDTQILLVKIDSNMKSHTLEDVLCNDDEGRLLRYRELTQKQGDCYYFRRYKYLSELSTKTSKKRCHFVLEECPICLTSVGSRQSAWITWCGHLFHKRCLREWCYTTQCSGSCPMCRKEMGPLEFLDGLEYTIYPEVENFCDLLEEVPNLLHKFCYECNGVLGMNPDKCCYCRVWLQVGHAHH